MNIRVLGCHGSQLPNYNTTSYLIGRNVLVDAGTVTTVLSLPEQLNIDYIFVTHAHLDHVRDLAFLADNIWSQRRGRPLIIVSTKGIIEAIHRHIFNNVIWPDFSRLPSPQAPLIIFKIIKPGKKEKIGDLQIRAIDLHHVVETVGYVVTAKEKAVIFFGDTGPTEEAWRIAKRTAGLKAVFAAELKKLTSAKPGIYLYHMKPSYHEAIRKDLAVIKDRKIHIIEDGQTIRI